MAARRGTLLLVGVWLFGALLTTTVGLLAVRQVREEVGDPGTQPLSASDVQRAVASATPSRAAATRAPRAHPTARPTARPTAPSSVLSTATVVPAPPVATRTRTATAPTQAPAAQRRTFQTTGGSLAVECSGRRPSLVYVLPAEGWAVEDQETHADRVEVHFRSQESEVEIRVVCNAAGTPVAVDD